MKRRVKSIILKPDLFLIITVWSAGVATGFAYYSSSLLVRSLVVFGALPATVVTVAYMVFAFRSSGSNWFKSLAAAFRIALCLLAVAVLIPLVLSYVRPLPDYDTRIRRQLGIGIVASIREYMESPRSRANARLP